MHNKSFKAATILVPDHANRLVLEEAFNTWAEETKPNSILHVHYYHEREARVRGYQVVYEEAWTTTLSRQLSDEEPVKAPGVV
jgi:hypothetical protein